jgi:hypothetical protein
MRPHVTASAQSRDPLRARVENYNQKHIKGKNKQRQKIQRQKWSVTAESKTNNFVCSRPDRLSESVGKWVSLSVSFSVSLSESFS